MTFRLTLQDFTHILSQSQLAIDELLPEVDAIAHKPVKKPFKKRALYKVRKSNP
ncbi:hypothetical protein [Phormidesmis priestleyi]|uniref:hypothetical protein n=1 Tax=Phormidesmis priestleyi TaxID=268141 RepID=UPI0012E87864|nr:hypothetical protein [Phormidesmis priestleyi]